MKSKIFILLAVCLAFSGCGEGGESEPSDISSDVGNFLSDAYEETRTGPENLPELKDMQESSAAPQSKAVSQPQSAKEEIESQLPVSSSVAPAQSKKPETMPPDAPVSKDAVEIPPVASSASEYGGESRSGDSYLSDTEFEVIELINKERKANGLGELSYDKSLTKAARIRSGEMFVGSFFDHSRKNRSGWETVLKDDVPLSYKTAGENLAMVEHNMPDYNPASDASYWFDTWKNSPTHYANMLKPEFTHIGAGIYHGDRGGLRTAIATTIFASF